MGPSIGLLYQVVLPTWPIHKRTPTRWLVHKMNSTTSPVHKLLQPTHTQVAPTLWPLYIMNSTTSPVHKWLQPSYIYINVSNQLTYTQMASTNWHLHKMAPTIWPIHKMTPTIWSCFSIKTSSYLYLQTNCIILIFTNWAFSWIQPRSFLWQITRQIYPLDLFTRLLQAFALYKIQCQQSLLWMK